MQKVKIKTWKRMEKEFGLTDLRAIKCHRVYTKSMEDILPKSRVIEIELNEIYNEWSWDGWLISNDMIAKYY